MSQRKKLCIVTQRFGATVTGGAEYHARWVLRQLRDHFDITIFTTNAADYLTWEPDFETGESQEDGVSVVRFPVEKKRDLETFNAYSEWIFHERHRPQDERRWLEMQGPCCPQLLEAIRQQRSHFDLFIFFTYLYYPTVLGLPMVGDRSILLPTAHDEWALRFDMYEKVFAAPLGFLLNTHAERRLIDSRFDISGKPTSIVGVGIDFPEEVPEPQKIRNKYDLQRPYAIGCGRISRGKGFHLVFEALEQLEDTCDLVLFGKADMELPDDPRIRYLGFIDEEDKWPLFSEALFSIHPSQYESLSLALLESWAMGTPALVNGTCEVLQEHVEICGGGLYYKGVKHLVESWQQLMSDPEQLPQMGQKGKAYTQQRYRTDVVRRRYIDFIEKMIDMRSQAHRVMSY